MVDARHAHLSGDSRQQCTWEQTLAHEQARENKRPPPARADRLGWYLTLPTLFFVMLETGCAKHAIGPHDQAFRRIQVHEAELANAQARLLHELQCTAQTARDEQHICGATRSLCELSSALGDRDASLRCLRASDACSAAREHRRALCATQAR
jgi:hypothetical protein